MTYPQTAVIACLEDICDSICVRFHHINRGGCAVFAAEIGKRLDAHGIKDFQLRSYAWDNSRNITDVENANFSLVVPKDTRAWNQNGVDFDHIVVEYGKYFWDGKGGMVQNKTWNGYYKLLPGAISLRALKAIASNPRNWNTIFDRSDIPKIRRVMDRCFKKLRDGKYTKPLSSAPVFVNYTALGQYAVNAVC